MNNLLAQIKQYSSCDITIIGIGNAMKGDDGFGPVLISRLQGKTKMRLFDCGQVPENYAQPIIRSRPQALIVIDAADFAGRVGELRIINKEDIANYGFSTHNASLGIFFDYLMQQLPELNIFIIGVQVGTKCLMQSLSPEVQMALNELVSFFSGVPE